MTSLDREKKSEYFQEQSAADDSFAQGTVSDNADHLKRKLGNRQIQLLAIGGSIGTGLFVSIGSGLRHGGPASLLIAYILYSIMLGLTANGMAELTTLYPVSGGFVRLAGWAVDDALAFAAGWNYFFYEALLIPFEITALDVVLTYWRDDIPSWAVTVACIALYAFLNVLAVKWFGEAEFWLSGGKVILILMLFCFTFITMIGGNPQHDAYGFRAWSPTAFAEYLTTGDLGRWEGFLACVWSASFTVVGPEYISMVAAEAKRPRIYIKEAFKTLIYYRLIVFFIGAALAVGILVRYNDPLLIANAGAGTAAASPFVVAMENMGIGVLPHIVNALLVTSIFSAGNSYTFCSTRQIYSLALEGRAPKILSYCTKAGVPIYAFGVAICFSFLSFLNLSKNSANVLNILLNLITAGGVINYIVSNITYLFWWRAAKAQNFDRNQLPYKAWFQPYSAWIGLVWMVLVVFCFGYTSFLPWDVTTFFEYYTMLIAFPVLFIFWKVVKRTKFVDPYKLDLVWERPVIDTYEASFISEPVGFWTEMVQLVGLKRRPGGNDRRRDSVAA